MPPVWQSPSPICPIIVERDGELASLTELLARAEAGRGGVALLSGPAGIGKSRLAAELRGRAAAQGWVPLQGRSFAADRALPYAPLIELLRAWLAGHPPAVALDPYVAALLAAGPTPAPEQRALIRALVGLFTALSANQPILVILEDLHWSDEATLEVVRALARAIGERPALLLLTYRSDEIGPELAGLLADLDRERCAIELALQPLDRAGVAGMVRAIYGLATEPPEALIAALASITEGNPFFVEEILKSLDLAGGPDLSSTLRIPRSVQLAVQRRLALLGTPARELLTFAAVIGRRFDFDLLRELTHHDEDAQLLLIKQLMQAQLVVEESADRFAFRHELTRQAVLGDLLARERRAISRAVAAAMEQTYAAALDAHLADLAQHYDAAEDWPRASEYSRRAGDQARALQAPRAAVEQYSRAIAAAARAGSAPDPAVRRARGQMYELLGMFDAALADYQATLALARAGGDCRAEWQGLLDLGWLLTGRDYHAAGDHFAQATALARTMGDPATLAETLNRVGNWHTHAERPAEGIRCHQEALAIFGELGDRAGAAATLDLLGITSFMGGDMFAGSDYYAQAIALFRALGDRQGLAMTLAPYATRGASPMHDTMARPVVPLATAQGEGEEAVAAARAIEWPAGEAFALMYLGLSLCGRGVYARALEAVREAQKIATAIEHPVIRAGAGFTMAGLYIDLLAADPARRYADEALALAHAISSQFLIASASSFFARACVAQGDYVAARAALDAALAHAAPMSTLAQRLCWGARAELLLAEGQPAEALALLDALIAAATHAGRHGIPRLCWLRGEALLALGQPEEAVPGLETAVATAQAQGARPLQWRAQLCLARVYRALGRRAESVEAVAAVQQIVADLAAGLPDETLRVRFQSGVAAYSPQIPPPTALRVAKQAYDGLTARERQVAALVAQGRSNRAIAEALVLSERTVAKHVENILSRLGFESRVQIAAWAVEKGLMPPS